MPYDSRVYRVLIASPSDVEDERELAVRVIQQWNDLHSYSRKVVLLPLRWETHTGPEYGTRPQEAINRAIVDDCDLLVGAFWTRIGTPSGEAESGTLEEIERVASVGKPVMLYFSQVAIDPYQIDMNQQDSLRRFKELISAKSLTESYKSQVEFRHKFSRQLEMRVRELQASDSQTQPPPLTLEIFSTKQGCLTTDASYDAERLIIKDLDKSILLDREDDETSSTINRMFFLNVKNDYMGTISGDKIDDLHRLAETMKTQRLAVPIALVVTNSSDLPLDSIFLEILIRSSSPLQSVSHNLSRLSWAVEAKTSDIVAKYAEIMAKFKPRATHAYKSVASLGA